jgi:hypothetical protein
VNADSLHYHDIPTNFLRKIAHMYFSKCQTTQPSLKALRFLVIFLMKVYNITFF